MTEAEWLACDDPVAMVRLLANKPRRKGFRRASDRKLRLLACAGSRLGWNDLTIRDVRRAVEMAESFADGAATREELRRAHEKAVTTFTQRLHRNLARAAADASYGVKLKRLARAADAAHKPPFRVALLGQIVDDERMRPIIPFLLRDIFGNPFRVVAFDPSWLTPTVTALAAQMYESRDFNAMPILADALQDAGCDSDDILGHCRGPGPHARGCWVVDLVLGKG